VLHSSSGLQLSIVEVCLCLGVFRPTNVALESEIWTMRTPAVACLSAASGVVVPDRELWALTDA
jgi:hypothetical protein